MSSMVPDYYISSAATPSTGSGTFGDPYALADLSIAGGAYKAVTAGDIIAAIADGAYTLPANINISSGNINAVTILRGCKSSDGSWDDTRATLADFTLSTFFAQMRSYNVMADLKFHDPVGTQQYMQYALGSASLSYNIICDYGAGTAPSVDGFWSALDSMFYVGCKAIGTTDFGFNTNSVCNWSYCEADGCNVGFNIAAGGSDRGFYAHCIAKNSTFDGFAIGSEPTHYVHCLAYDNGGDGFDGMENAQLIGCMAVNNGEYGFRGPTGVNRQATLFGCSGYNNTSGLTNFGSTRRIGEVVSVDPDFDAYLQPQETTVPTLGELLGAPSGSNYAGPLTIAGAGGDGASAARAGISGPAGAANYYWPNIGG